MGRGNCLSPSFPDSSCGHVGSSHSMAASGLSNFLHENWRYKSTRLLTSRPTVGIASLVSQGQGEGNHITPLKGYIIKEFVALFSQPRVDNRDIWKFRGLKKNMIYFQKSFWWGKKLTWVVQTITPILNSHERAQFKNIVLDLVTFILHLCLYYSGFLCPWYFIAMTFKTWYFNP